MILVGFLFAFFLGVIVFVPVCLWARFTRSGRRLDGFVRTAPGMRTVGAVQLLVAASLVFAAWLTLSHHTTGTLAPELCLALAFVSIGAMWFANASLVSKGFAPLRPRTLLHPTLTVSGQHAELAAVYLSLAAAGGFLAVGWVLIG